MFEVISAELSLETRAALARASVRYVSQSLAAMPAILPELSTVQRCQLRLALCEAVGALDACDAQAAAVARVIGPRERMAQLADADRDIVRAARHAGAL